MSYVKVVEDWMKLTETAKLNYGEIILLCKIDSLSNNKDKACTASNEYFSRLLCTTERNVKRYLKSLKDADVIKTFEVKQGMKNTTRYIYPQYNKIYSCINEYDSNHAKERAGDEIDTCNEGAGDNFGMSRGQFMSEQVTDLVKAGDSFNTQIREKKERKENKEERVADAPKLASLDTAYAKKWTPKDEKSKDIFGSDIHTDKRVMEILREEFGKVEYGHVKTIEDICQEVWVTACNVNTDKIAEYCNEVLSNKG